MASYNRIIMMGNLTRDPEYRQLASGQALCRLGLASNRQFKNKQTGTQVQEVCFIDIDVWGPQAESCRQYLSKGRSVLVEGRLKLDTWQENDGTRRSKHSIVADRVTFLASGQQADDAVGSTDNASGDASLEGADMSKQQSAQEVMPAAAAPEMDATAKQPRVRKAPTPRAAGQMGAAPGGEVNFKDEAPFEDDLPF